MPDFKLQVEGEILSINPHMWKSPEAKSEMNGEQKKIEQQTCIS